MNGLLRPSAARVKGGAENSSARLRAERLKVGIDQGRAAVSCGVSLSTYKRWERGAAIPSDALLALADAGFDVQYIVTGIKLPDRVEDIVATYGDLESDRASLAARVVMGVAEEIDRKSVV